MHLVKSTMEIRKFKPDLIQRLSTKHDKIRQPALIVLLFYLDKRLCMLDNIIRLLVSCCHMVYQQVPFGTFASLFCVFLCEIRELILKEIESTQLIAGPGQVERD